MSIRVVIIGAGQAGLATAAKLRQEGFTGSVTLVSDEPFLPYQRPPLSKAYLLGKITPDRLLMRDHDYYSKNGIEIALQERALSIALRDKTVVTTGRELHYDHLVLTTGARPVQLPDVMTNSTDKLFYLRTIEDADRIRGFLHPSARMLVIGGGYIGLEVAAAARLSGAEVTLVEAAPRILNRVAAEPTAAHFRELHRAHGVCLHEGVALAGMARRGAALRAFFTDGTELEVDAVVTGIGIRPNIELAQEAGLTTGDGIVVDACGRTSDPAVWAAGDCASFEYRGERVRIESVQNAIEQAQNVALNILGSPRPYRPHPWFWSDQYSAKLQIAGYNRGFDRVEILATSAPGTLKVSYFASDELISVDCVNDPRAFMAARRMIEREA